MKTAPPSLSLGTVGQHETLLEANTKTSALIHASGFQSH
jgi:hypothetical protein